MKYTIVIEKASDKYAACAPDLPPANRVAWPPRKLHQSMMMRGSRRCSAASFSSSRAPRSMFPIA